MSHCQAGSDCKGIGLGVEMGLVLGLLRIYEDDRDGLLMLKVKGSPKISSQTMCYPPHPHGGSRTLLGLPFCFHPSGAS